MEIQATVSGATTGEEVASHAVLHSDKFGSALTVQLYINKSWKNGMWYFFDDLWDVAVRVLLQQFRYIDGDIETKVRKVENA